MLRVVVPPLGNGIVVGLSCGVPQEDGAFAVAVIVAVAEYPPTIWDTVTVVVAVVPGFPMIGLGEDEMTKVPYPMVNGLAREM